MEFGVFLVGGNVGVGFEKERSGVQPIRAAMDVRATMDGVGAGGGAHINMRAAGVTLWSVIHAGVDAQFLDGFRRGSRQRLSNSEIRRSGALYHRRTGAGRAADAGIFYYRPGS